MAISLRTATGGTVAGIEETSLRALAKLQQMLPSRLRHRVGAFTPRRWRWPGRVPRRTGSIPTC